MADNIFKEDEDTKKMILEISSLFGVKSDIVRQVWQYTVFSIMLRVAESDDTKLTRIKLPYIGSIGIKTLGMVTTPKGVEPELDVFVSLSDTFKNLFMKSQNGNYGELSNYVQKKFIEPVVENITDHN
jgi:hypothetical protein